MNYQEKYNELIDRLIEAEEKQMKVQSEYLTRRKEQEELEFQIKKIEEQIKEIRAKIVNMTANKRIENIKNIIYNLTPLLVTAIYCVSLIILNNINLPVQFQMPSIISCFLYSLTTGVIAVSITKKISDTILNKHYTKIKNSNNYKELIRELELKNEELEKTEEKHIIVIKELVVLLKESNKIKKIIDQIETEIRVLKNKLFYNLVEQPVINKRKIRKRKPTSSGENSEN